MLCVAGNNLVLPGVGVLCRWGVVGLHQDPGGIASRGERSETVCPSARLGPSLPPGARGRSQVSDLDLHLVECPHVSDLDISPCQVSTCE